MTLYLLNFNNYYNRIVKKYDNVADYQRNGDLLHTLSATNFNPNDGISCYHDFNYNGEIPDYMLAVDGSQIISRWFVTEAKRLQGQQLRISFYRDVIADWYDDVVSSPCFIEKALLTKTDPGIYNSENMTYNQIRQRIDLLYDRSNSPWLVGYMPRGAFTEDTTVKIPYSSGLSSVTADYRVSSIDQWAYANQLNRPYALSASNRRVHCIYQQTDSATIAGPKELVSAYKFDADGVSWGNVDNSKFESIEFHENGMTYGQSSYYAKTVGGTLEGFPNNINDYQGIYNTMTAMIEREQNSEAWDYSDAFFGLTNVSISSQVGKTILDTSTNTLYTVNKRTVTSEQSIPITSVNGGYFRDYWKVYFLDSPTMNDQYGNQFKLTADAFILKGNVQEVTFYLDSSSVEDAFIQFKIDEIGECEDSPYNIFCMPYSDTVKLQSSINYSGSKNLALGVGSSLSAALGDGRVYDVQILPYCPLQNYISTGSIVDIRNLPRTKVVDLNDDLLGELIWLKTSTFSFEISKTITSPSSDIEFKVAHECDFYRLCSPNMSSVFEFKPTMFENGVIRSFEVDCVYKPFNPYIHINPKFSGMYGNHNQYETRGLTLGGDFSLARTSSAWENYELNNKYYQEIFDRQIKSLELQNKYQGIQDWINAGVGSVGSSVTGGMMGAGGGPVGIAIGAAAGGTLSLGAGITDALINKQLREDALDLTKDQFGYNLQTIQAIPDTLTRTSAQNQNNPLIPTLEYYTCTDIEKQALRNKIKYNGMTVMRIGTIQEFKKSEESYIKGKIIRLPNIYEDYHITTAIADEINQGVFI